MTDSTGLEPQAILATLGIHTPESVVPVTGGTDTAIWRVEHNQLTSALRVFRSTQAPIFQRELLILQLAADHGIPVPIVRAHGFWQDRPVMLLSWCAGQTLASAIQRAPWRLLRFGRQFGHMQALIHRIEVAPLAGLEASDWITWHHAVDGRLAQQLRACASPTQHLIHLDYHPLNVMIDGSAISGVLDWANSRAGDPRADVARTYTILAVEPHMAQREPLWYRLVRRLFARNWLNGYQATAGRLENMPLFFAWAGQVMQADLAPRLNNPNSWWQPHHHHAIEQWTKQWLARIG